MTRSEILYSCDSYAKPILHDTMLQLGIERETLQSPQSRQHSLPNLLLDNDDDQPGKVNGESDSFGNESLQVILNPVFFGSESVYFNFSLKITGSVVNALKLSLTRLQYEQMLDTVNWLTLDNSVNQSVVVTSIRQQAPLGDISEEDTGVTTLNMDPHVRAKLFPAVSTMSKNKNSAKHNVALKSTNVTFFPYFDY